jgi:NLR family CARD domain-containing protein 3
VLDLSWNTIGQKMFGSISKPGNIGPKWGAVFENNRLLIHLDLSFNKIGVDDCRIMSEKLRSNHSLYGIHFQGNAGKIDSLGFLNVIESKGFNLRVQHVPRQIESTRPIMIGNRMAQPPKKIKYQYDTI